ncbi:MAG: RNA methyltransferase [Acidimicrobiia bacterium]|nr:RNA methyltransferase [Acidimicrobiia bacterium]
MVDTACNPEPIPLGGGSSRLKRFRRLVRQTKVRSDERAFVVDGPTLVAEALASPCPVEGVYLGAVHGLELLTSELDTAGTSLGSTPVYTVDDELLTSILDPTNPRSVAAVVESPSFTLADIDADLPLLVAVELRDPGNLGTIIRTAEAAGFGGVVIVGNSVDHLNPKAVRASAGSVLRLPIVVYGQCGHAVDALRSAGRRLVATVVEPSAAAYDRVDLTSSAILVGNEPRGLDAAMVTAADTAVTIPMADGVESLNVGAAAAVLAFEVARQRRNRRSTDPDVS